MEKNGTFYSFKPSGKYYTSARGYLPTHRAVISGEGTRAEILKANGGKMPGLSGTGAEFNITVIPDEDFDYDVDGPLSFPIQCPAPEKDKDTVEAERERCAKLAEEVSENFMKKHGMAETKRKQFNVYDMQRFANNGILICGEDIAKAIREEEAPKQSQGLADIAQERRRQVEKEGWNSAHDDNHVDRELVAAAACYAFPMQYAVFNGAVDVEPLDGDQMPLGWPEAWDVDWYKPTNRRRDLVKAGALIVAELDRLDREEEALSKPDGHDDAL